jgi:hypothetical protein
MEGNGTRLQDEAAWIQVTPIVLDPDWSDVRLLLLS